MEDEDTTIVALLHDVAEDTDYTLSNLRGMGFGNKVIEALVLLTHDENVPYMDYVREIRNDPIATKVKLADLRHNMDLTRLNHDPTVQDLQRREKYAKAERILLGEEE